MSTIESIVLIVHTLIAVLIIGLVLLQRGKGADAGAAFGSGASGTVFGARGSASFFSRATAILATAFFASSLALAWFSSEDADAPASLLERTPAEAAPAVPEGDTGEPAASGDEEGGETADLPGQPPSDEPSSAEDAELPEVVPAEEPPPDEPPGDGKQP